jgi:hypothetical protein
MKTARCTGVLVTGGANANFRRFCLGQFLIAILEETLVKTEPR